MTVIPNPILPRPTSVLNPKLSPKRLISTLPHNLKVRLSAREDAVVARERAVQRLERGNGEHRKGADRAVSDLEELAAKEAAARVKAVARRGIRSTEAGGRREDEGNVTETTSDRDSSSMGGNQDDGASSTDAELRMRVRVLCEVLYIDFGAMCCVG